MKSKIVKKASKPPKSVWGGSGEFLKLARDLKSIEIRARNAQKQNSNLHSKLHSNCKRSGENFVHYLALRQADLKDLQLRLAQVGLSSLGRAESCVIENVQQTLARVSDSLSARGMRSTSTQSLGGIAAPLTWSDSEKLLHQHTRDLLGPKPEQRHVYIMVTAPVQIEFSEEWVREVIKAGANLVRINCAHDSEPVWRDMVRCIRAVSAEMNSPCRIFMDLAGPKIRTGSSLHRKLSVGSEFWLVNKITHRKREIECSAPEVFKFVKPGSRVFFDDGKIEARVVKKQATKILLKVAQVPAPKTKLKAEKGINFPDSLLKVSEVTAQDLLDLDFVAKEADIVGMSFVQSPRAVRKIRRELSRRTEQPPGIVLKIETKAGFQALPSLLLAAMQGYPCGVMIARGDLAVEAGFERLVEIQEEILWLCEAAQVPVIWATQVLESQAKLGLPSRAEVTDAATAVRAECVMLNKGSHITSAIRTLDNILRRMEHHVYKKRTLDRKLMVANCAVINSRRQRPPQPSV